MTPTFAANYRYAIISVVPTFVVAKTERLILRYRYFTSYFDIRFRRFFLINYWLLLIFSDKFLYATGYLLISLKGLSGFTPNGRLFGRSEMQSIKIYSGHVFQITRVENHNFSPAWLDWAISVVDVLRITTYFDFLRFHDTPMRRLSLKINIRSYFAVDLCLDWSRVTSCFTLVMALLLAFNEFQVCWHSF
jgi:hypothetical protein